MTTYPPTHCCNPAFQYITAEETKKSGYLAMRFARIVAAREMADADSQNAAFWSLPPGPQSQWTDEQCKLVAEQQALSIARSKGVSNV